MLKLQTLPTQALAVSRENIVARWLARPVAVLLPLIVLSSLVRSAVAWKHETPRYFPDEYIYAALGRSLAHGHYEIRGHLAHFPAFLEPLLAAPLWRFFSTETAYHLVQAENAVAASLVAVPIYLLARWLGLGRGYGYLCAAYGLLIPAVSLAAENITDLVAYPLVLTAVAVGVRALDTPSPKRQVAFLAFATLATLARTQYFVLVPAYILAALLLERRRMFRAHKVAVLALIPVAVAITVAMLGFYSGVRSTTHLNAEFFKWFLLQAFLLALAAGVAIVPGALIAFVRPTHRREIVFSLLAGAFMVLLFCESTVYAANSGDFKERYLFSAMPLLALAYGVYLKRGRPHPYAVVALVAVIVVAASRLPISVYAISDLPHRLAVPLRRELARAAHELRIDRARDRAPRHRCRCVRGLDGIQGRPPRAGARSCDPRCGRCDGRRRQGRSPRARAPRGRSCRRTSRGSTQPPTARSPQSRRRTPRASFCSWPSTGTSRSRAR